jgi:hypothetical protein
MKRLIALLAILAILVLTGCGFFVYQYFTETFDFEREAIEVVEIGEGETMFHLYVAGDGVFYAWDVRTNQSTVGAALAELGLIDGEEGAFGMFVTTVNGIIADFDADGAWWAFEIDSEMSPTGVDATYIEEGRFYAFVLTR